MLGQSGKSVKPMMRATDTPNPPRPIHPADSTTRRFHRSQAKSFRFGIPPPEALTICSLPIENYLTKLFRVFRVLADGLSTSTGYPLRKPVNFSMTVLLFLRDFQACPMDGWRIIGSTFIL